MRIGEFRLVTTADGGPAQVEDQLHPGAYHCHHDCAILMEGYRLKRCGCR